MQTGSMGEFGHACTLVFPRLLPVLSILGGSTASLRFVAYGDYDTPRRVVEISRPNAAALDLVRSVDIGGGGDAPEAVKTALYEVLRCAGHAGAGALVDTLDCTVEVGGAEVDGAAAAKHVVFLFTDAPPHVGALKDSTKGHITKERARLKDGFDWLALRRHVHARGVPVVTFMEPRSVSSGVATWYSALGPVVNVPEASADAIAAATLTAFEHLIGETPEATRTALQVHVAPEGSFDTPGLTEDGFVNKGLHQRKLDSADAATVIFDATSAQLLGGTLPSLPGRLKRDAAYRAHVVTLIEPLLNAEHVRALMTFAVLGKIWRALASFRRHDEDVAALCDKFGLAVQDVNDPELSAWVLSTYNRCAVVPSCMCSAPALHCLF